MTASLKQVPRQSQSLSEIVNPDCMSCEDMH